MDTAVPVLVLADDPHPTPTLVDGLAAAGYTPLPCRTQAAALAALAHAPALAILDVLPAGGTCGLETFRLLRADPRGRAVPVLFLAAPAPATVAALLRIAYAGYAYDAIVGKPCDPDALLATARRLALSHTAAPLPPDRRPAGRRVIPGHG